VNPDAAVFEMPQNKHFAFSAHRVYLQPILKLNQENDN
jgi:hypothetical protein